MLKKTGNILWGVLIIALGALLALKAFLPEFDIFFDGWWTLFIIVPCAIVLAVLLIVSIFSAVIGTISSVFSVFENTDGIVGDLMFYGIWEEDDIKNLDISLDGVALEIKNGEAFSVESNRKFLTVEVKNGTLVIENETPFYVNTKEDTKVILTIPEGFSFDLVKMETGAGKFTVEALNTKKLRMELGAGETVFENLIVTDEAEIQAGVGKFSILNGRISDLDFNVGIGDVSVTAELLDECEFD